MSLCQVSDHIWYLEPDHRSDRPVLGYVHGRKLSFAVDAGASNAHVALFYNELNTHCLPLPNLTGISHYHWDHSYGAAYVSGLTLGSDKCNEMLKRESVFVWTKEAMQKRVENRQDIKFGYCSKLIEYQCLSDIKVVPPDIVLSGNIDIDLGGVTMKVLYCGGPHSEDHLIFFVPEEQLLFLSDASGKELFSLEWEYDEMHPELLQNSISQLPYNREKLRPFVALLESLNFTNCILGHADKVITRDELLSDLKRHI